MKTNRQVLLSTNECDYIYAMQCRIDALSHDVRCIMDALGENHEERCKRHGSACRECIAAWLNEEAKQ